MMSNKTKILFVIGGLGVGGKERQLIELINGLPQNRYELHLMVKRCDAFYVEKVRNKLSTFRNLDQHHFRLFDWRIFAQQIGRIKPDIVCSWTNVTSHFCLLAQLFTAHSFKIINCCIRNAPVQLSLRLQFEKIMYSFYKTVVANSHAGLKAYGQQNRKGRHVLYNGFDFSRQRYHNQIELREKLNFLEKDFIVVMVANFTEKKDHETLLRAVHECKGKSKKIEFYLVGEGPRRQILEKMAKELNIDEELTFLGKRDDVEDILKAANLSVLISTSWFGEGISNSIIESMGCGTPVIATESPGTMEVIQDGFNGILVPCEDHSTLAVKIIDLYEHPEVMKSISKNAQKTVKEKFSIGQLVKTFMNIVDNC